MALPLSRGAARRVAGAVSPETAPVITRRDKTLSAGTGAWPEGALAPDPGRVARPCVCHVLGGRAGQEPCSPLPGGQVPRGGHITQVRPHAYCCSPSHSARAWPLIGAGPPPQTRGQVGSDLWFMEVAGPGEKCGLHHRALIQDHPAFHVSCSGRSRQGPTLASAGPGMSLSSAPWAALNLSLFLWKVVLIMPLPLRAPEGSGGNALRPTAQCPRQASHSPGWLQGGARDGEKRGPNLS